jgi:hypothetical protein
LVVSRREWAASYKLIKYLVPVCTGGALLDDAEGVLEVETEPAVVVVAGTLVVLTGTLVALVALVAAVAGTHWSVKSSAFEAGHRCRALAYSTSR